MDICFEKYFELSRDEYSKIKKIIDNNIDTFESIFAHIHSFVDLYCYYPFNFHSIFELFIALLIYIIIARLIFIL